MPRKRGMKFWVDWSDKSYPRIRVWRFHDMPEDTVPDAMTLLQAKREIIEHFTPVIAFARDQIRETRQLTAEDIVMEEQS